MDKETVKSELIKRVDKLPQPLDEAIGDIAKLVKLFQLRFGGREDFAIKCVDLVNQILKENGIDLDESQKRELIEYLKPTISELSIKYLKGN